MWWEKHTNFSSGEVSTGQTPTGNSERPVHNFPEKQILTFYWRIGNQEQARTVLDRFGSSVTSTGRHLFALDEEIFTARGGVWCRVMTNETICTWWNRKCAEYIHFRKKNAFHSTKNSEIFETGTNSTEISLERLRKIRKLLHFYWKANHSTKHSRNSVMNIKWNGNLKFASFCFLGCDYSELYIRKWIYTLQNGLIPITKYSPVVYLFGLYKLVITF